MSSSGVQILDARLILRSMLKVEVGTHAAVEDKTMAFLALCGPKRRTDSYPKTRGLMKYLEHYEPTIIEHFHEYPVYSGNLVIVHGTTRSVSWWGGVSYSHATFVGGRAEIQGTGVGLVSARLSVFQLLMCLGGGKSTTSLVDVYSWSRDVGRTERRRPMRRSSGREHQATEPGGEDPSRTESSSEWSVTRHSPPGPHAGAFDVFVGATD